MAGRRIVVRVARPGEHLITLDGVDRALDPEDLVIADRDRGSALAGVMGGGVSEIAYDTSRVLVESAWFAPAGIRRTARRHGLKTEASYRFERGADPGMVLMALDRCAALIAELSGGTVRRGVCDACPRPFEPLSVGLRWNRPAQVLGQVVPRDEARRILTSLGFVEQEASAEASSWRVPSWRRDVEAEEDLIEELVRERGYASIPETLPRLTLDTPAEPVEAQVIGRLRAALEAVGFSEAVNFSFVAPADLSAFDTAATPLALRNPISADLAMMRTSLLPSLLRNLAANRRQRVDDVRLYELARCYATGPGQGGAPAREWTELAGVLAGRRSPVSWATSGDGVDLFDAKGAVSAAFDALGIVGVRFESRLLPWAHPRFAAAALGEGGRLLGEVAELHPRVAAAFELPRGVFVFRLELSALLSEARLFPRFAGVPRFPAVLGISRWWSPIACAPTRWRASRAPSRSSRRSIFDVYTGPSRTGKRAWRWRCATVPPTGPSPTPRWMPPTPALWSA